MSKCLRCGATSEWIQGKVPDEPAPESQWQPIETAPKDQRAIFWVRPGTEEDGDFYVYSSGKPIISHCEAFIHVGLSDTWSSLHVATHWMPLPAPPTQVKP